VRNRVTVRDEYAHGAGRVLRMFATSSLQSFFSAIGTGNRFHPVRKLQQQNIDHLPNTESLFSVKICKQLKSLQVVNCKIKVV